jgi:hypothetical protein
VVVVSRTGRSDSVDVNVCRGALLGTQVWVGHDRGLDPATFQPVRPDERPRSKPREGGLWTAQWDETYGGGWVQSCILKGIRCSVDLTWHEVWLLEPESEARILVIDSYADLERAYAQWGDPSRNPGPLDDRYLAWHKIAAQFDAVRLTEEGQWRTRLPHPPILYGWDCESTLWLRWAFAETHRIGSRSFAEKPCD